MAVLRNHVTCHGTLSINVIILGVFLIGIGDSVEAMVAYKGTNFKMQLNAALYIRFGVCFMYDVR